MVDLSVSETLHNLVALAGTHPTEKANLLGEAAKVAKQFKVPDKVTTWTFCVHAPLHAPPLFLRE